MGDAILVMIPDSFHMRRNALMHVNSLKWIIHVTEFPDQRMPSN